MQVSYSLEIDASLFGIHTLKADIENVFAVCLGLDVDSGSKPYRITDACIYCVSHIKNKKV
jgi:hypothetical protein